MDRRRHLWKIPMSERRVIMAAALTTVVGVCTLILLTAHASEPPPAIAAHVVDTDRYPAHDVTFANGARGIAAPGTTGTVGSPLVSDCAGRGHLFGVFDMATIQAQAREAKALSRETRDAPEWQLLGCVASTCTASQLAMASPVAYVDETDPPMLLLVGTNDTTVPTQQTLEMADRLKMKGVKHEVIAVPDVDHNFLGKTWQDTRAANLNALAATFRFFDSTVGNGTLPE
jgi:acetyl esterase/lipase